MGEQSQKQANVATDLLQKIDALLGPGGATGEAANALVDPVARTTPGVGTALRKLSIPAIPLAVAGAFALPSLRSESGPPLAQEFSDAQSRGETPMSDSFRSFVQRRKHGQVKEGNMRAPAVAGSALGDAVKNLIMQTKRTPLKSQPRIRNGNMVGRDPVLSGDARQLYETGKGDVVSPGDGQFFLEENSVHPGKLLGTLGGLGALGVGYNALTTSADNPLQYKIQKAVYGPQDRTQMEDEYLRGLSHQGGKETAGVMRDLVGHLSGQAVEGAKAVPRGATQSRVFQQVMENDEMLRETPPEDQELLSRAYQTMQRFAPELATDEFAVKNYLREALMASSGPDYATISSLARTSRDVSGQGRR